MHDLPSAGRLAAWGSAALAGAVSPDEAADAVAGRDDPAHRVTGIPGEEQPVVLSYALARLRSLGATGLRLVLPRPGDVNGLPGPPDFNRAALDAGAAVLTTGTCRVGLIPTGRCAWSALPVSEGRPPTETVRTAELDLARAVREATDLLTRLDVARWDPAADALGSGHSATRALPSSADTAAHRLLAQALRISAVVEVARGSQGAAASGGQIVSRDQALRALDDAVRRAIEAACSPPLGPTA